MIEVAAASCLTVLVEGYLPSALLLSVGAAVLAAIVRWAPIQAARAPQRWLTTATLLVALALALPWTWRAVRVAPPWGATVEVWNGPRVDASGAAARISLGPAGTLTHRRNPPLRLLPGALGIVVAGLGAGALLCVARWMIRRRRPGRLCLALPVVKRVARVRVCASDLATAPFAAAYRGIAFIVVPTALLSDFARLRLVLAHEAHHHRRGDLRAAALFGLLRAAFFWNPLLALWESCVAELQDLACDRQVLRRSGVAPAAYGRALLWAADAALGHRYLMSGARGIAVGSAASLKRRLLMLDEHQTDRQRGGGRTWAAGIAAGTLLVATSWAVHGSVADHRVTRERVGELAARIETRAGFPVLVDDQVVARLNQWVAVPQTRELMIKAVERMPAYRGMIEQTLHAHRLPVELLGMVMAESRFDNEAHPNTPLPRRSAGIWQLIPQTGRELGLKVSPVLDERLEPRRATEAAATILTHLFDRYRDWPVAIAAYNAGEKKVDALAAGAGSPAEVRARVLAGEEEHAHYVRAVMASVILIENPALLE